MSASAPRRPKLRKRLSLDASRLIMTFQSRFGSDQWLQPYTDRTMEKLAKDGVKRIAVVTPGFSPIAWKRWKKSRRKMRKFFSTMAASNFHVPCLNDSEPGMDVSPARAARASGLDLKAVFKPLAFLLRRPYIVLRRPSIRICRAATMSVA